MVLKTKLPIFVTNRFRQPVDGFSLPAKLFISGLEFVATPSVVINIDSNVKARKLELMPKFTSKHTVFVVFIYFNSNNSLR